MLLRVVAHLGRIRVDRSHVVHALGPLQHDLLHVGAQRRHFLCLGVLVDEIKEPGHVTHELLADALACAVDGELQGGRGVEHGGGEHGNRECFPESVKKAVKNELNLRMCAAFRACVLLV